MDLACFISRKATCWPKMTTFQFSTCIYRPHSGWRCRGFHNGVLFWENDNDGRKNSDDMFCRFDTIADSDRQTDRWTVKQDYCENIALWRRRRQEEEEQEEEQEKQQQEQHEQTVEWRRTLMVYKTCNDIFTFRSKRTKTSLKRRFHVPNFRHTTGTFGPYARAGRTGNVYQPLMPCFVLQAKRTTAYKVCLC